MIFYLRVFAGKIIAIFVSIVSSVVVLIVASMIVLYKYINKDIYRRKEKVYKSLLHHLNHVKTLVTINNIHITYR